MKVLTLRQPWAWAVAHGGKDVENRTWTTRYRGPIAIHAGLAKPDKNNLASRAHRAAHGSSVDTRLHFGAIVAVADLVDVHAAGHHYERDGLVDVCTDRPCCGPWAERGVYHWRLGNVIALRGHGVPHTGAQGLRDLPPATMAKVIEALPYTGTHTFLGYTITEEHAMRARAAGVNPWAEHPLLRV